MIFIRFFGGVGGTWTFSGFTAGGSGFLAFLTGAGGFAAGAALFFFRARDSIYPLFSAEHRLYRGIFAFSGSAFGLRFSVRTGRDVSLITGSCRY
ncbi:hypothetical protein [Morganella morganii]|uniref:hypothetical protein n=1 Tax=Morganella morganii TaxID=582 RepID=UPI0021CE5B30|nr:hypothetical protein [Morganella morganii]MCU6377197.1 hypothetical protein [Morganella morganii]